MIIPLPKDPQKLDEYRKNMSRIAKEKGYGKWMLGKTATDETKEKMSLSQCKRITPDERKVRSDRAKEKGYGKWMEGRKLPVEVIEKIASHKRGRTYVEIYGKDRAIQEASKRKEGNVGKRHSYSEESLTRIIEAGQNRRGSSYIEIYGRFRAQEESHKRSLGHQKRWVGKIRKGCRDKQNGEIKYKRWRSAVFERDDFTCQNCGVRGHRLHAHHIKEWSRFPEFRYVIDNGITLCPPCHSEEHPENKALTKMALIMVERLEAFRKIGEKDPIPYE